MTILGRAKKSAELDQCKGLLRQLAMMENRRIRALEKLVHKLQHNLTTDDEKLAISVWINQTRNAELLIEQYHNEAAAVIGFIHSVPEDQYMLKTAHVEGKISAIWSAAIEVMSFVCAGFDLA